MLIDEEGKHKLILGPGERKNLRNEHTILVPGAKDEIAIVRYVYGQFIDEKQNMAKIADALNAQGIVNSVGRRWTNLSVRELLTNEKYMGTNVYGRTSKKLGSKSRRNPKAEWVKKPFAFDAIIPPHRYQEAQRRLEAIRYRYTKNDMLDFLSVIWCKNGFLSRDIIDASPIAPSTNVYKNRFGSLTKAFRLVGFTTRRLANRENLHQIRNSICDMISAEIGRRGGTARRPTGHNCMLLINEELAVLVVIGRASLSAVAYNQNQWRFGYRCQKKPDLLVVARVDHESSSVRDYYLLPFIFFPHGSWITVSGINYQRLEAFRSMSLDPFFDLCARKTLDACSL